MNHDEEGARLTGLEEGRERIAKHRQEVANQPPAPSEQLIEYQHKNDASPSSPWFRQYEKDRLPVWAVNVRPALPSSEKGTTGMELMHKTAPTIGEILAEKDATIDTLRGQLVEETQNKKQFERDWLEACDKISALSASSATVAMDVVGEHQKAAREAKLADFIKDTPAPVPELADCSRCGAAILTTHPRADAEIVAGALKAAPSLPVEETATDYKALYTELVMQVTMKHPGETLHQTALRYLRNAEHAQDVMQGCSSNMKGGQSQ